MDKDATINARIPAALRAEVDGHAKRLGWKPARIVREALEHYLSILSLGSTKHTTPPPPNKDCQ